MPPAPKAPSPTRLPPAAVLVVHGMGQQVPFETLDQVHRGLRREEVRQKGPKIALDAKAEQVRVGNEHVRRLEIELRDAKGRIRPVHLYEGYWAPVTEGRVTLRDVISFLVSGGWNGLTNAGGRHTRWVFGQERPTPRGQALPAILFALLVVFGLAAVDLLVLAASGALLGRQSWPGEALRSDLTWLVGAGVLLPILLFAFALFLGKLGRGRWRLRISRERQAKGEPRDDIQPTLWHRMWDNLAWLLFFLTALGLVLVPLLFGALAILRRYGVDGLSRYGVPAAPSWFVYVLLLALAGVSLLVRHTLVQTLGDVAAYVQTHKLDRFNDLRNEIKKKIRTVADAIYAQDYDRVAVVGHSLGSVVAYNTLNDLLNDDADAPPNEQRRVLERTRLLLTFGSPLDKLAFIFATQRRKTSWTREMLSARVQPLVYDYRYRRTFDWVNVHAKRDIVSGSLDLYDAHPDLDPRPPTDYRPVENVEDAHARIPLLAHNEYWANPRIWWELRRRIVD